MNPKRHWTSTFLYFVVCPFVDLGLVLVSHARRTLDRITRFALGDNPRIAKFATRLLASLKDHEDACVEIIQVRLFADALCCYVFIT